MAIKGDKKLVMVTSENNNKFYNMHDNGDGTFTVEWGRIGVSSKQTKYPISQWDRTYRNKTKKGYKDVTEMFVEAGGDDSTDFTDINDPQIARLIQSLQSFANSSVQQNYMVTSESVTQRQIDQAQALIDELARVASNSSMQVRGNLIGFSNSLNELLLEIFSVIPRRMSNVRRYLFGPEGLPLTSDAIDRVVNNEQATLDVMRGQVQTLQVANTADKKQTLLDAMGITIEQTVDDDIANIELLMGPNWKQFKQAFRVTNKKTEQNFDDYRAKQAHSPDYKLFWHGSRNENWWSILDSGLALRPANAIITGKMFGYGIYFADKCQKSVNYTSLRGSYWARGSQSTGFLALYKVNTGNWLHARRHESWMYDLNENKLKSRGPYDSLFAEGGVDLRNNEYIVYNQDQTTIQYLVEIGA